MAIFGGYRSMWLMVMFDLPTLTSEERSDYRHFHDFLLNEGFIRLQYSVYARHCGSDENGTVHIERVQKALPPDGEVRIMSFTDKQFARMQVFYGPLRRGVEQAQQQVLLL